MPQKTRPFPISLVAKGAQKTQLWPVSGQQNLQEPQGEFFLKGQTCPFDFSRSPVHLLTTWSMDETFDNSAVIS